MEMDELDPFVWENELQPVLDSDLDSGPVYIGAVNNCILSTAKSLASILGKV